MAEPNVLLLDEPTNDLDVDTLPRLEDLLDGWPGTLVVVSHDRYLVERACDTVVALLGDGKITHLPGGIEEYLAPPGRAPADPGQRPHARSPRRRAGRQRRRRRAPPSSGPPARRPPGWSGGWRPWPSGRPTLHDQLAEAATDPDRLLTLDRELKAVVAERESRRAGVARGRGGRRVAVEAS